MAIIYHLVLPEAWTRDPDADFCVESLRTEGFIHCSHADQVAGSANRYYATAKELLVLHIDTSRLKPKLVEEASKSGAKFPHIYGALNRNAVVKVETLRRGTGGEWVFGAPGS